MRKSLRLSISLAVAITMLAGPNSGHATATGVPACADSSLGCWLSPFSENGTFDSAPPNSEAEAGLYPTAVSIAVMPDGSIIYWDGLTDIEKTDATTVFLPDALTDTKDRSRILDLGTYDSSVVPIISIPASNPTGGPSGTDNLFCADQRLLSNGKLVVAGGTKYEYQQSFDGTPLEGNPTGFTGMGSELYGSKHTRYYDSNNDGAWSRDVANDMNWLRWYPSLVTTPDGNLFVAGGVSKLVYNSKAMDESGRAYDLLPRNVNETEVFDAVTGIWTDNPETANKSLPLFARIRVLPSGEIAFLANGQQFNPMGEDVDQYQWNNQSTYDPATKTWRDLGVGILGARSGAADVMLRLEPDASDNYSEAKVLMAGGTLGVSPGTHVATPLTEIVTLSDSDATQPGWEASTELGPALNNPRWFSRSVLLPNGDALVMSGGNQDDVIAPGSAKGVHQAELFNGEKWIPLSMGARDRVYHNSAILLKDGSVLVGGHAPINQGYGGADPEMDDRTMGFVNSNLRDPSFERFFPPYLYNGDRPVVQSMSTDVVTANQPVNLTLAGSEDASEVVLSRLPSQTHVTDADARTVKVKHSTVGQNVQFEVPSAEVVPPGFYYVFVMSDAGVPSIAEIINVT